MKSVTLTIFALLTIVIAIHCNKEVSSANVEIYCDLNTIPDSIQFVFETQTSTIVMKKTRLFTDSIIEKNSIFLSDFSERMRQRRWSRIKSGAISLKKYLSDNILATEDCFPREIDTIVGNLRFTCDNIPYLTIDESEMIILNFIVDSQEFELNENILFIGYFEKMSPVNRRFSGIFTVVNLSSRTQRPISHVTIL